MKAMSNINEVQKLLSAEIMSCGSLTEPRGMTTKEVLGASFSILNPRNRRTTLKSRGWSPGLAVAELLWNFRGEETVEPLAFYNPRWRDFADSEGIVRGSCYGAKIFRSVAGSSSQWENVKKLLKRDPSTRRAVIDFRIGVDVSLPTNDMSCTNSMQFIVREGVLHAFVSMRSNDLIWGVPYDVFLFTCLQEQMAVELGFQLGTYHHYAASLHIYERHFALAEKIAAEDLSMLAKTEMPAIQGSDELSNLSEAEKAIRENHPMPKLHYSEFENSCIRMLMSHPKIQKQAA